MYIRVRFFVGNIEKSFLLKL